MTKHRNKRMLGRGKRFYFPRQPRCSICKRKIEFGELCYYCHKRRVS